MDLKSRISTPLEAGTSILDAHRLPSFMVPALEYTSQRLADKGLHITLVVARRDYQLPDCVEKPNMTISRDLPVTNLPSPPCSPNSPDVMACGPSFTSIKSLVRSGSQHSSRSTDKSNTRRQQRSKAVSLSKKPSIASLFDGGLGGSRLRWSHTSNTASCLPRTPRTPATPATPASFFTATSSTANSAAGVPAESQGGIRLIYTTPLAQRAYKLVTSTLARAARKFNLSTPLTAHEPSTYNLPPVALHGSILQNEVLLSSEGLTLLSLDHLYTFKAALNHYATTRSEPGSHFRLEDAVDELRRYVLSVAGGRRRLLKSVLVAAYDWLGPVNDSALNEVTGMYSRAYGGATEKGIEDDLVKANAAPTIAASVALAKVVDADAARRLVTLVPEPPPKSAARASRQSAATATTTVSPPASPEGQRSVSSASTLSSFQSQKLLSSMSSQNWVVEDYSPWADEGMINVPDTPRKVETPMEGLKVVTRGEDVGAKTPVAPKATAQSAKTPTSTLNNIPQTPQIPPCPSTSPPSIPSPRVTPRASLPSLRVQTSFATTPKPRRPAPRRKQTPAPAAHLSRQEALEDLAIRPSPAAGRDVVVIETTVPDDSDAESALTEFEDGDVTARSPAKTPGGSLWLGIDEVLGGGAAGGSSSTGARESRAGPSACRRHRRRSSSLHELRTPGGERLGPTTPNGYDDISPVTRGEWGFLMVSDPFKTKTAAVSCV